jgi:hypothetical protein
VLRLASDADVNGDLISALRRQLPEVDLVRVQDALPMGVEDRQVLAWAAAEDRVLLTADRSTMIGFARERVSSGQHVPGLIVTTRRQGISDAANDIALVAEYLSSDEVRSLLVLYLPYKD